MIKWEYSFLSIEDSKNPESEVDEKGEQGWELVSVVHKGGKRTFFYFKRQKIEAINPIEGD